MLWKTKNHLSHFALKYNCNKLLTLRNLESIKQCKWTSTWDFGTYCIYTCIKSPFACRVTACSFFLSFYFSSSKLTTFFAKKIFQEHQSANSLDPDQAWYFFMFLRTDLDSYCQGMTSLQKQALIIQIAANQRGLLLGPSVNLPFMSGKTKWMHRLVWAFPVH